MRLELSTWLEVEHYLKSKTVIIVPVGSTEQHGPMGLIGTDALCSEHIAQKVGERATVLVGPTLNLTPAPFNLAFPGTISLSEQTFRQVVREVVESLSGQGFSKFYFLNGHGANLKPLEVLRGEVMHSSSSTEIRIRSWWDFDAVNVLRREYYGDWEGMHATPSEIAITQAVYRSVPAGIAEEPPRKLSAEFIKAHSGDKHGPAAEHRRDFPDGRVGSHSALAKPHHGEALVDAAVADITKDLLGWIKG